MLKRIYEAAVWKKVHSFQNFNSSPLEYCSLVTISVHSTSKIKVAFLKRPFLFSECFYEKQAF